MNCCKWIMEMNIDNQLRAKAIEKRPVVKVIAITTVS